MRQEHEEANGIAGRHVAEAGILHGGFIWIIRHRSTNCTFRAIAGAAGGDARLFMLVQVAPFMGGNILTGQL